MLIDLHGHSSGISRCCQIPAPEVLRAAKDAGLDGIVLSNILMMLYSRDEKANSYRKIANYLKYK